MIAPAISSDASDLVATIERARALFDEGDVRRARVIAAAAFEQAKTQADFAERFGATEALVGKARQLQGDALLIETRAKIAITAHWDEAKADGLVSKGGRGKAVSDGNGLTAADTGLSRKELHDARRLGEAEAAQPGLVARAIAARLAAGLEPTRANLRVAVGTASASKDERGDNFYQTPDVATRALLALERFSGTIWEPACGHGAISAVLEECGYGVMLSDLVDRGTADSAGVVQSVGDFLGSEPVDGETPDIVTNPPYGEILNAFVAHALRVHRPRKMALLLNLNFLCGFADDDRNFVMDDNPPARIWVFKRRLPMMHREGWTGNIASSRMNTAWFVWERRADGSYGDETVSRRVDWKDFSTRSTLPPVSASLSGFDPTFGDAPRQTPARSLDERVAEWRGPVRSWVAGRDRVSLREISCGVGLRRSTVEAILAEMVDDGTLAPADADGWHEVVA